MPSGNGRMNMGAPCVRVALRHTTPNELWGYASRSTRPVVVGSSYPRAPLSRTKRAAYIPPTIKQRAHQPRRCQSPPRIDHSTDKKIARICNGSRCQYRATRRGRAVLTCLRAPGDVPASSARISVPRAIVRSQRAAANSFAGTRALSLPLSTALLREKRYEQKERVALGAEVPQREARRCRGPIRETARLARPARDAFHGLS